MTSVGVGWVEGNEDHLADQMREEVLNVASGLRGVPCGMLRSDKTAPAISLSDFLPSTGGAQALASGVDLLVLAGHGSGAGGLVLKDGALKHNTVTFGGTLRFVVMVSCAILEGELENRTVTPISWKRVFGGLHRLIAPCAFVSPHPGRGEMFASYLNDGYPVLDAWELAVKDSHGDLAQWRTLVPLKVHESEALTRETLQPALALDPGAAADFVVYDLG